MRPRSRHCWECPERHWQIEQSAVYLGVDYCRCGLDRGLVALGWWQQPSDQIVVGLWWNGVQGRR